MSTFDDIAVNSFREYLRIPSVHPNVNYEPCVQFLKRQAKELDLPVQVFEPAPGKPVVVLTWQGTEPQLPAILLNSHMDVVPVYEDSWKYKPFDAHMDADGNIYARGAQDMKCVGIQYLEAVRRLRHRGINLRRTVHISFVPDEEIGGIQGMKLFVRTEAFKNLNIGFSLDEGMASETDVYNYYNAERSTWYMHVHCLGQPGHGSLLLKHTAGEKIRYMIDKFMDFRAQESEKLEDNSNLTVGDITSINMTMLEGGVQPNVIPEELVVVFDARIPVTTDMAKFEQMINDWCTEAGPGVWISTDEKRPQIPGTILDESNPYWLAFKSAIDKLELKTKRQVAPAATDSRFIRELGIPAISFSPMICTPIRLHDHNEFLNKTTFLRGIEIYCEIIASVTNAEDIPD